jgi:hypothetical protein
MWVLPDMAFRTTRGYSVNNASDTPPLDLKMFKTAGYPLDQSANSLLKGRR